MADEQVTQDDQAQPASQPQAQDSAPAEDYKAKYESLQSEHTRTAQELAEKQKLLEMMDFNNGGMAQNAYPDAPQAASGDPEEFVTQKSMMQTLGEREKVLDAKIGVVNFRMKYPDLVPYENNLMVGMIENVRRKIGGRANMDTIIDRAASELKKTLDDVKKQGESSAEKRLKSAASASGLGSAGTNTPKSDDSGTEDDYLKYRTKLRQQRAG